MSFGIEIRDEIGQDVFSVGRKYLKIVGSVTFPAASSRNVSILESTFSLPSTVPLDEEPFIKCSIFQGPKSFLVEGRVIRIQHSGREQSSVYYRDPAKIFYGYYA